MKSHEPLANYDPASSCWRTCEDSLPLEVEGYSGEWSGRWPSSGMTRRGTAYALPTSAHRTGASGCSSLLTPRATRGGSNTETVALLPTPVTTPETGNGHARNLSKEIALLPTPEANTGSNGGSQHPDKRRAGGHAVNLQDVAEHLLCPPRPHETGRATTSGETQPA